MLELINIIESNNTIYKLLFKILLKGSIFYDYFSIEPIFKNITLNTDVNISYNDEHISIKVYDIISKIKDNSLRDYYRFLIDKKLLDLEFQYQDLHEENTALKYAIKNGLKFVDINHKPKTIIQKVIEYVNEKPKKKTHHNYQDDVPHILYYILIDDMYYKIGITKNSVQQRFSDIRKGKKIKILKLWQFSSKKEAYTREQLILSTFQNKRLYEKILENGNTEMFKEDILELHNDTPNYLKEIPDHIEDKIIN